MGSNVADTLLPYKVGALLYAPGINQDFADKILHGAYACLTSVAFCLEDTIQDSALQKAEKALKDTLGRLRRESSELPMLFVRVRTPEHLDHVHALLDEHTAILTGYILPKFDLSNGVRYVSMMPRILRPDGTPLFFMPILESRQVADLATRQHTLLGIRDALDVVKDRILNVRVGATDLCNLFGLRRSCAQTIYDVGVVRDVLMDILNVFTPDYVVSGPVWEYFGTDPDGQWAQGLRREVALDILNGFIGKTAMHPSQLPVIHECMQVSREEYEEALQILNWTEQDLAVAGNDALGRMEEVKCHSRWARKITCLASVYGIRNSSPVATLKDDTIATWHGTPIMRLAKRFQNVKRPYLLVNPLQGKHMPVAPEDALGLMDALASELKKTVPECNLVIGFAETATAIAARVAHGFGKECAFVHTTREQVPSAQSWIEFKEEHSHATEQRLCADQLGEWICHTDAIVLVDDELTTGNTMRNLVEHMRRIFPQMQGKRIIAASIVNRLSEENLQKLAEAGVECVSLVQLPDKDYACMVADWDVKGPEPATDVPAVNLPPVVCENMRLAQGMNPRTGVLMGPYDEWAQDVARRICERTVSQYATDKDRILVLGAEECMYVPLLVAERIHKELSEAQVTFHATTRSPIGVLSEPFYPIVSGYALPSVYDADRPTYVYDVADCDLGILVADAPHFTGSGVFELRQVLGAHGCSQFISWNIGSDV